MSPGSGGASYVPGTPTYRGGKGGGAVYIQASGTVTIDGVITARGTDSEQYSGGGAGGSVYITCNTFGGTSNGLICADGGNGHAAGRSGAGAGGRIAVNYANLGAQHAARFSTVPGSQGWRQTEGNSGWNCAAQRGTVWLPDTRLLSGNLNSWLFNGVRLYPGTTQWGVSSLAVSNCSVVFGASGFKLTVTNSLVIGANGILGVGSLSGTNSSAFLRVGQNLVLTNSGDLFVYAGRTNGAGPDYGVYVGVTNTMYVGPGSWVYPFANQTNGGSPLFRAANLTVTTNAGFNADEKGFRNDMGPGKAVTDVYGGGAGYGGKGGDGRVVCGGAYGSSANPVQPGSGGGSYTLNERGGNGGGAIRMIVTGTALVNGTFTARGGDGDNAAGGGSGGAINLNCGTLGGSNGQFSVNGGNPSTQNPSGSGGGGRISIAYTTLLPGRRFRCNSIPGAGYWECYPRTGDRRGPSMGTIYFSGTNLLSTNLDLFHGYVMAPAFTSWSPKALLITTGLVGFADGFRLRVTSNMVITGTNAGLVLGGNARLDVGGSLILTNGGQMRLYSGPTNTSPGAYGLFVGVTGTVVTAAGSWIHPFANKDNGGAPLFRAGRFVVMTNGGFNADSAGYTNDAGPGHGVTGTYGGGGGHGGKGGDGSGTAGGPACGSSIAPVLPGSGGGSYQQWIPQCRAPYGGGVVRMEVANDVLLQGRISANSDSVNLGNACGGGSGGSIFILCKSFTGNGTMKAEGGVFNNQGGGGGGGRVAVGIGLSNADRVNLLAGSPVGNLCTYRDHVPFTGTISVTNGTGYYNGPPNGAGPGTRLYLVTNATLTVAATPANYGSPYPRVYGTHIDIPRGMWVTNDIDSPVDEQAGSRHVCFKYTLVDSAEHLLAETMALHAVFQLNTNLTLTWHWTNQYQLTVSSGAGGYANGGTVNGWYTNAFVVTNITATASNSYEFFKWTGAVPPGQEFANPISVTMTQVRSIVANFALNTAQTNSWSGTGRWENTGNWSLGGMPSTKDMAIIRSGSVILGTPVTLARLVVSNGASLMFTNWTTVLTASNVAVRSGGAITLAPAFGALQMSNRVNVVCTNFVLEPGASINADGKGYAWDAGPGKGPGVSEWGGGAGHGGRGGDGSSTVAGNMYGSPAAPVVPGSGGVSYQSGTPPNRGGPGGGAVRLNVRNTATINGTISANGSDSGWASAGGSGGSVYITCGTFAGTSGLIRVCGGTGSTAGNAGGAGGGGRIAVSYTSVSVPNTVRFAATPGTNGWHASNWDKFWRHAAEAGTLSLPDTRLLSPTLSGNRFRDVRLVMGVPAWSVDSLVVSNCALWFEDAGFRLKVTNDMTLYAGTVGLGPKNGSTNSVALNVGGNLAFQAGSRLYVYAGMTNGMGLEYGALVSVTGGVTIGSGSWIYPYAHADNGAAVRMRMNSLTVSANGGINADAKGYRYDTGPGKGGGIAAWAGGGGYGGRGSDGSDVEGGNTYGLAETPKQPGSGGGSYQATLNCRGGYGGGAIQLDVSGAATVNGTLTAVGDNPNWASGGGSGGGIWLSCATFSGSGGLLSANGGDGIDAGGSGGGCGGGGRIAVNYGSLGAVSEMRFSAASATTGFKHATPGDRGAARLGTVRFPDLALIGTNLSFISGYIVVPGFSSWSPASLRVTNAMVGFPGAFNLSVAGNMVITGAAAGIVMGTGAVVSCGGNLVLGGGGQLRMYAAATNSTPRKYGSLLGVTGQVTICNSAWIYPYIHATNGGAVLLRMGSLTIDEGGGIKADQDGYGHGSGPGHGGNGTYAGGAGYGGRGGDGSAYEGGPSYGSSNAPILPGSGGGDYVPGYLTTRGGTGGGVVWIDAGGPVTMNGTISVNGQYPGNASGGGAGGSIWILCDGPFAGGLPAIMRANGMNGVNQGGGGAGGRISVWYNMPSYLRQEALAGNLVHVAMSNQCPAFRGSITVNKGTGWYNLPDPRGAQQGSVVFYAAAYRSGMVIIVQ